MKRMTVNQAQAVARAAGVLIDAKQRLTSDPLAALRLFEHADAINQAICELDRYASRVKLGSMPVHEWIEAVAAAATKALADYAPYLAQEVNPAIGRQAEAMKELIGGIHG